MEGEGGGWRSVAIRRSVGHGAFGYACGADSVLVDLYVPVSK